jgi:hypothetical protein
VWTGTPLARSEVGTLVFESAEPDSRHERTEDPIMWTEGPYRCPGDPGTLMVEHAGGS